MAWKIPDILLFFLNLLFPDTSGDNMVEKCTPGHLVPLIIIVLAILGGAYILSTSAPVINLEENPNIYVSSTPPEHTIDVSATATDYVDPDMLVLSFTVENEAEDATESQTETASEMNAVKAALTGFGIKDEDIKTTRYSVDLVRTSHYICENETSKTDCYYDYVITGYETTHSIQVDVYDLDNGGDIVDAAAGAGAEVDSISFTLKPETRDTVNNQLLEEASGKAKTKAQSIATGLGVTVGGAFSASAGYDYYPTYRDYDYAYAEAGSAPAPTTELSGGQIEVTASVSASFEIQ